MMIGFLSVFQARFQEKLGKVPIYQKFLIINYSKNSKA